MCVGASCAGEVTGVEFGEGGVGVVNVEDNEVVHQATVVYFHDRQGFDCDRAVGALRVHPARTSQRKP